MRRFLLSCSILVAFAVVQRDARADTVAASCRVQNPNNILENVAGHALAQPTGGICQSCPTALGMEFNSACTHVDSGVTISSWVTITPSQLCTDNPALFYENVSLDTQNANDACSGAGCGQPTFSHVFGGIFVPASFPLPGFWDWTLLMTIQTNAGVTHSIGNAFPPGFERFLVARGNQPVSHPYPRWHNFEHGCFLL